MENTCEKTCTGIDRERIEKLIKASGCEIISRAGELSEGIEQATDLDIWVRFSVDELPHIEVTKRYVNREMLKVLAGVEE